MTGPFIPTQLKFVRPVPSDIDIAQAAEIKPIAQVAEEIGILPEELEFWFEHSVANMYFIPYGLFIQQFDPAFVASLGDKVNLAGLTWCSFLLNNLLPVTIGNIIGGAGLVGIIYWVIYLRGTKNAESTAKKPELSPEQKADSSHPAVLN